MAGAGAALSFLLQLSVKPLWSFPETPLIKSKYSAPNRTIVWGSALHVCVCGSAQGWRDETQPASTPGSKSITSIVLIHIIVIIPTTALTLLLLFDGISLTPDPKKEILYTPHPHTGISFLFFSSTLWNCPHQFKHNFSADARHGARSEREQTETRKDP